MIEQKQRKIEWIDFDVGTDAVVKLIPTSSSLEINAVRK